MITTRVLVESLVRADGTVDAGELYAIAAILGMTDQQVRLCIKRLVAEGRFTHEGRGRRALLRATAEVFNEVEFVRYAYRQDQGLEPWDGRWRLVAFAIPETARAARDSFRDAIVYLGGAFVQGGLYVTPNDWDDLIAVHRDRLGIGAGVTTLTTTDLCVGGERDPRRLAAALWPLGEIAERYVRLGERARQLLESHAGLARIELLAGTIEVAAQFTAAMEPDPLLPPELLPRPWPGTEARALSARCFEALRQRDGDDAPSRLYAIDSLGRHAG
ncbi:PaaX family transcriptional regulator C-terminal domain-containing protein [Allorhizocola rhizosphaerae]|uniref:PaaX family transcriptional regulator C-terminal domain-containing protein n=1 Tax=Allorhizocola rhizosphaerae TaxID=1872709 RepID=UPI000E3E69CB|nr:PaaX family transcriptional regulator C-terminal domain-containing protein [Allorhizocola rhizosphaerae]